MESQVRRPLLSQVRAEERDRDISSAINKEESRMLGQEEVSYRDPKAGDLRDCFLAPKGGIIAFDP